MPAVPKGKKPKRNKPRRLEHKGHLERLRGLPCALCGKPPPSVAHHLIGNYGPTGPVRGWGLKAGDNFTIPLCENCHNGLHDNGDEKKYFRLFRFDGFTFAKALWSETIVVRD